MLTFAEGYGRTVFAESITIPERLRPLNEERVQQLMESVQELGLQTPITVRDVNDGEQVILVAGRHRLEAARRLGWDSIEVIFVEGDPDDFRLWEIAENLHRSELTVLERSEHIAEWVRLTDKKDDREEKPAQVAQVSKGGRGKKSGISAAATKIGVERRETQRAIKVDSIAPEAKQAARDAGIDKNQSALLKVAAAPAEEQVEAVRKVASKPVKERPTVKPAHASDPAPNANEKVVLFLMDTIGDRLGELVELLEGADIFTLKEALRRAL